MKRASIALLVFFAFASLGFIAVGAQSRLRGASTTPPHSAQTAQTAQTAQAVSSPPPFPSAATPPPQPPPQEPSGGKSTGVTLARGLIGDYFNLPDRGASLQLPAGNPTVRRIDQNIWFDWGRGAPAARIGKDNFGVRWQGYLRAENPGKYVFQITHVGLARLWLGGQPIFSQIARSAQRPALIEYTVTTPGWIPISAELIEGTGASSIQLAWSPPNTSALVPIPNFALAHRER